MSSGLRNSTIETFRKRNHGENVLRLYSLAYDGESLNLIAELSQGFFLTGSSSPHEGAPAYSLTIDSIFTDGLTGDMILNAAYLDMVNPTTLDKQRYQINSNTPPVIDEWRYLLGVDAAFNDEKAVV